jgi:uncharacterized protein (DUF2336 family)
MPSPLPKDLPALNHDSGPDLPARARSLIEDLEAATHEVSQERRVQMLRSITDLFIGSATAIGQDQADLFGDVLGHLIQRVETEVLAELGAKLAPLENAPNAVVQSLARHDEIAVAGAVLAGSIRLTDDDLIEIAKTKGQDHLGAISERGRIAAGVTDVLVERGNAHVVRKLSRNNGAAFSDAGFEQLAARAKDDEHLAESLAQRLDLPVPLLEVLVSQATEALRGRMLAAAPPQRQEAIEAALANASGRILRHAAAPRDFSKAQARVALLAKNGSFNDTVIQQFANDQHYEEVVAGLAKMSSAPIALVDQLMSQPRNDGIIVLCKAASIRWPVCSAILTRRFPKHEMSATEVERARSDYLRLSTATAQRALRFWLIRGVAKTKAGAGEQPH